jgi:uncharacterized protein with gpF-like domain
LNNYTWRTAHDERVRPTHKTLEGKLCRWDDSSKYSVDGGVTWLTKGGDMEQDHAGMAIRCRCSAEGFVDDILAEGRELLENVGKM